MKGIDYDRAASILADHVSPVSKEFVEISNLSGRILAEDVIARMNVPCFSRSPYDGYAFVSSDTDAIGDGTDHVTLKVIESIRAGQVPKKRVTSGCAVRLMTGSPVPAGADCICKFEDTDLTKKEVKIKRSYKAGENIVAAGEDIKKGSIVSKAGSKIDPGTMGILSSLGLTKACVYKRLKAGVITTGDEVCDIGRNLPKGKIYDSNRYIIGSALEDLGVKVSFIGHADDKKKSIRKLIKKGSEKCDLIVTTGGVSVGDFDLVPDVLNGMGFMILADSVAIKPGMACVYAVKKGKVVLALSGNPASALTNLQGVCAPAIRKMTGLKDFSHTMIEMKMKDPFVNKSDNHRLIRGRMFFENGQAVFDFSPAQGNVVISSAAGANAVAVIEKRCSIPEGEIVKGFLI